MHYPALVILLVLLVLIGVSVPWWRGGDDDE